MRRLVCSAFFVFLAASAARAAQVSASAIGGYEQNTLDEFSSSGIRQTYNLRLDQVLTTTSIVHFFFRANDFQNQSQFAETGRLHQRQLQAGGDGSYSLGNFFLAGRHDVLTSKGGSLPSSVGSTIQRSAAVLTWTPDALPVLQFGAQRNATESAQSNVRLTDEAAYASLNYEWRSLLVEGGERRMKTADRVLGYERTTQTSYANLSYAASPWNGRMTMAVDLGAQLMNIDESAAGGDTAVPVPLNVVTASYGIDDTPSDGTDHPLSPMTALIDNDVNTITSISLGPDAPSFQNIALDIGRLDDADEIRVIVRDASGNPLERGGGAVTFDVYTSVDNRLWSPVQSLTQFDTTLSLYSVTFPRTKSLWFKVVSFGANITAAFVTEVQAFHHDVISGQTSRSGTQRQYNGSATVSAQPLQKLTLIYASLFTVARQDMSDQPLSSSTNLEHLFSTTWAFRPNLSLRTELTDRKLTDIRSDDSSARGVGAYLDYKPTTRLTLTLHAGKENDTLRGERFSLATTSVRASGSFLKSVWVSAEAGVQRQTLTADQGTARRTYGVVTVNAQLLPTVRNTTTFTIQRNDSESTDPAVQLLGPQRDTRATTEFLWRPGRPLAVMTRFGWVSGREVSGFTQQYHVDWFPFGDGTVSLGGSYDEDIDPVFDRRSTRAIFSPRWQMNRHAAWNLNYVRLTTRYQSVSILQRTILATLTLTK